jgi:O-antigen/teichoic acid export membrane protein
VNGQAIRLTPPGVRRRRDADVLLNLSRRLVYLGMFLLPLLSLRLAKGLDVSDGIFALAAVVLILSRHRPAVSAPPMWYFGSFLIVIGGITASFLAASASSSMVVVFNGIFVLFVWQWTTRSVLTDIEKVQKAITAFVLGTTLSSAVAILQIKLHILGYAGTAGGSEGGRAVGLASQPNIAAVTYALGLTFAIGLALHLGAGHRWHRAICIGLIAVALLLSASVSGIATALVGVFVLLVKRGMKPRTIIATAVLLVGIYALATALEGNGHGGENLNPFARVQQTTSSSSGYDTVSPREDTWVNAWKGIQQDPIIGHGIDQVSLQVYYDPYLGIWYPAHNLPLLLWYGGGIFMLVGFAVNMTTAFRRVTRRGKKDPTKDMLFAGMIVVLFFSMQSPEMFDRWLWLPFILALSLRWGRASAAPVGPDRVALRRSLLPPLGRDRRAPFTTIPRRDLPSCPPLDPDAVAPSKRTTASAQWVLILTIIDQGASSVSNFALAILVAHYSDASAIGVFAILTTTYVIAQGIVRSLTSDCLLTRPETDDTVMASFERGGYLAALAVSVALGICLLLVSGLMSSEFTIPLAIFAVSFPFMALQDFSRFIGISRQDPAYAIRLDIAWLVLFLVSYGTLRSMDLVSLPWLFGAWCGTGALVGLTTMRSHLARRGRQLLEFWVKSERAVGVRFAGQFMLVTSWSYFIVYLLVLVIALSAIGHFKLAQLSIGPITVMAAGLQAALVSLGAKRFQVDKHKATHFLLLAGSGTALVTLLWTGLVYFAPVHTMTTLLGPSWPQARILVPYVGLGFALSAFSGAATSGLRAVRAAKENLHLAIIMVPFLSVPCMGGALLWGARGAAIGLCFAYSVYSILGWILLARVVHRLPNVVGSAIA